ncbi:hypothetical protein ACLB2K_014776 [Fragaria x ananassa]
MMPEFCKPLTKEGVFHPLMMFDCKGYEPVDFVFGGGWKVESVAGKTYDNVDLSKGEFAEYDESGELLVRISSLHASFNVWRPLPRALKDPKSSSVQQPSLSKFKLICISFRSTYTCFEEI